MLGALGSVAASGYGEKGALGAGKSWDSWTIVKSFGVRQLTGSRSLEESPGCLEGKLRKSNVSAQLVILRQGGKLWTRS